MSDIQAPRLREQDLVGKVSVITSAHGKNGTKHDGSKTSFEYSPAERNDPYLMLIFTSGASKGIGRATALQLASRGCSILGTCSGSDSLILVDSLSHTISRLYENQPSSPKVVAVVADITKPDCADIIARKLEQNFEGHVDILVNNAALARSAKLGEIEPSLMSDMLFANVQTPMMIVNELVKKKMFRQNSRIVNISSDSARMAVPIFPGRTLYSTIKSALEGLARSWADELGANSELEFMKGTTANAVCVGFTETDATKKMPPPVREQVDQLIVSRQSLPYAAHAEEVADVVGFLCGRDSRWVTGAVIPANGGHVKIT